MLAWDDVRFYLAVQRTGTLVAAAKTLRVDATTVGRRIAALETAIGARLFERVAGTLALTSAGEAVLAAALRIETEIAVVHDVAGLDRRIAGRVRVATPEAFGIRFVTPRLANLLAREPALQIELLTDRRILDLTRREADLAVRTTPPASGTLVVRKAGQYAVQLYASTAYLAAHGEPRSEAALSRRPLIFSGSRRVDLPEERYLEAFLRPGAARLETSNVLAQLGATIAGLGIAALPCYLADAEPGLRCVLPRRVIWRTLWIVTREQLRNTPRIRVVADFLAAEFARERDLLEGAGRSTATRPRARS